MKIADIYTTKLCVFSVEVFPPKKISSMEKMKHTLTEMNRLKPDFISVTCGAGGTVPGGVSTLEIASFIKNELGAETAAHMTCMGTDREKVRAAAAALRQAGIENILTLRGDRRPDIPRSKDFAHASDLAAYLKSEFGDAFDLAGACYPEGHAEAGSLAEDVRHLLIKQEVGVTHLFSQLFFDNSKYYRFLNMARKAGVKIPISAGVMPIVARSQIERTVALSSASLPSSFTRMISRWQDDEQSLYEAGIEYAITQLRDLIEGGADGVHLYAMNNYQVAARVREGIGDLL